MKERKTDKQRKGKTEAEGIVGGYPMILYSWSKGYMYGSPGSESENEYYSNMSDFPQFMAKQLVYLKNNSLFIIKHFCVEKQKLERKRNMTLE